MRTGQSFKVRGLGGAKKLRGRVEINGAKNAALKAMAAAVLFGSPIELANVPRTADVETLSRIMTKLGAAVDAGDGTSEGVLKIDASGMNVTEMDRDLATAMRASVTLTGPMLSRFGRVTFPAPGGCVIGTRPIDLFLEGYRKMGATVAERDSLGNRSYVIEAPKGLSGAEIFFNKQTVGGTETLMMAAVLAKGETVLKNCAMEPEIASVAEWLNACGADIRGAGTTTISIRGTGGRLLESKAAYETIPDRVEAGSFLILGALLAEELVIGHCRPAHMEAIVNLLRDSGVPISADDAKGEIVISGNNVPSSSWKSVNDVRTHEYPGLPTDLQAPLVAYLTQVSGRSTVFETIYEGRFKYVEDLIKLGAGITVMNPREVMVEGPSHFAALPTGEELRAHDIRAGFAVVMAALIGEGEYVVNNIHLIDRGYERLEERLQSLGAQIERV